MHTKGNYNQEFLAPISLLWEQSIIYLLVILGLVFAPFLPFVGAMLEVMAIWIFWRHYNGYTTFPDNLVSRKRYQNSVHPLYIPDHPVQWIVLVIQQNGPSWTRFSDIELKLQTVVLFFSVPGIWLGSRFGDVIWYRILSLILVLFWMTVLVRNGRRPKKSLEKSEVNVDNMFDFPNAFDHTAIVLLKPGGPGRGAYGLRYFANQTPELPAQDQLYFLNLALGKDESAPVMYEKEGGITLWHADYHMISIAKTLTNQDEDHPLISRYSAVLPLMHDGYKCLTLSRYTSDESAHHADFRNFIYDFLLKFDHAGVTE